MAINFNFGSGSQGADKNLVFKPWQYTAAFRNVMDNGTSAKMTDILTPLGKKTSIKMTLSKIANVYQTLVDEAIPLANQSSVVSGQTVFCELKTIATRTASDGTEIQLPMVGRIELRLPNDSDITESDIAELVAATYAGLCDGNGNPVVVSEKMRGALTPAGI